MLEIKLGGLRIILSELLTLKGTENDSDTENSTNSSDCDFFCSLFLVSNNIVEKYGRVVAV